MSETSVIIDEWRLSNIYEEIRTLFLADDRPWIVGYSGGKDSTAALQMVWSALSELPRKKLQKKLYVISSDTFVENPVVLDYLRDSLSIMKSAVKDANLPFEIALVQPDINDSFWVNLIGRGYPAPTQKFRWCTDRLKIRPSNRFIEEKIAYHGEVIIVLGVRQGESATRDQVLSLRETKKPKLLKHTHFAGAYVFAPIKEFSVDEVWGYLLEEASPWGADNFALFDLYKDAEGGECPMVVDTKTPPCGNSRFGCWVCTLVESDKSMEHLIDTRRGWMSDLLEIRDFLHMTTDPHKKKDYRQYKRRNGRVSFMRNDSTAIVPGPYRLDVCEKILRMVLRVQKKIDESDLDTFEVIRPEELHSIRRIWRLERADWLDRIPRIYQEEMDKDLEWKTDDIVTFGMKEQDILQSLCEKQNVPLDLVKKLLDLEALKQGLARRSSMMEHIDRVFSEEWRSKEEVLAARRNLDR